MDEKEVKDLYKELEQLELDAGIRIVDDSNNKIFITRSNKEFCIKVDDEWFYCYDVDEVIRIIDRYAKGKIKAWLY